MDQSTGLKPPKPGFLGVVLVVLMLAALILAIVIISGFGLLQSCTRPQNSSSQTSLDQSELITTISCGEPVLRFGATSLRIQEISEAVDGSFAIPTGTDEIAYWLKGATNDYVFALSATSSNLALGKSLTAGELVSITWSGCQVADFTLAAPEMGAAFNPASSDQSEGGIVLFIQNAPPGEGFVIKGSPIDMQLIPTSTPAPGGPGIESEISLLETSTSQDQSTILVSVSILNYGASEFKVSADDVWLVPQNAAPLAPVKAKPSLPRTIKPGETEAFKFTFPWPASAASVLKIFSAEFDLDDF